MSKQDWKSTPEIEKCKAGDHVCITQRINDVIRLYPEGNPLFGMPNLKLVTIDSVTIAESSSNAPLQLNFKLFDIKVTGLENTKVINTKGFEKDTQYHELELKIPVIEMTARYEIDGKLLLLPIKGKDKVKLTLNGLRMIVKHKIVLEKRDGKNYVKTVKLSTFSSPDSVTFNFENLFDGNEELTHATNKVLSENSLDVWPAISEEFDKGVTETIQKLLGRGMECLSYDEFFAD
uniref:Uncharacterized protein n=1 Tax=Glossina brevipalpis TaxID=37001 RepID=A0A1A9W0Q6_9MUSC